MVEEGERNGIEVVAEELPEDGVVDVSHKRELEGIHAEVSHWAGLSASRIVS